MANKQQLKDAAIKEKVDTKSASKFNRRNKRKFDRSFRPKCDDNSSVTPGNDFSYHNKFADLMQSLLKYPWMHIQGTNLNVPNNQGKLSIGNVITAEFLMTPGVCKDPTDAFNLTSRDQWLELHRKYRGIGTYQQADYGITRLCIISLMIQILNAQRLYGIMHGYPVTNRVNPEGMLKALGYSGPFINSLKENLSDYRSRLNRIIVKSRRLCLPKDLAITKLWGGLTSFIYKDSKNERACYLAFNPAGFWIYNATDLKTGTAAKFERFVPSLYGTCFELLDDLEANLDIMLTDDDVSRMCSDTIAAYGIESMEAIAEFPESYTVEAVYDESILIKFHNCAGRFYNHAVTTFVSVYDTDLINAETYDNTKMYIYQKDNNVIFDPVFVDLISGQQVYDIQGSTTKKVLGPKTSAWSRTMCTSHDVPLLDTWEEVPSDATRCEAILWKNTFNTLSANLSNQAHLVGSTPSFFSTEIIGNIRVHNIVGGNNADSRDVELFYANGGDSLNDGPYVMLSQFDWAPFVYIVRDSGVDFPEYSGVLGDMDNYTVINVSSVAPAIFDCSTLSLFKSDLTSNS